MGQLFNAPPGWPTPPQGWTPPPGWQPDPSWPAAPDGWQFWVQDPFEAAITPTGQQPPQTPPAAAAQPPSGSQPTTAGQPAPGTGAPTVGDPTQSLGTAPTQVMGSQPGQSGMYTYAPSTGLEQPGASPYGPQGPAGPGTGGPGSQGAPYVSPAGSSPAPRNAMTIAVVAIVAVLVLGGIVWGAISIFSQGGEDPSAGTDPTTATEPSSDAESETPSDEPTTDEPTTEEPSDEPTDPATDDDSGDSGGGTVVDTSVFTDLTGDDPAVVHSMTSEPVVEIRMVEVVPDWQSGSANTMLCGDATNGQYLGVQFEFTILPAMAQESTPTYSFIGWEVSALAGDVEVETNGFSTGLFCVGEDEKPPSDMEPGETYTGWVALDVPDDVTAVTFEDAFDWSSAATPYRWVLADQ